MDRQEKIEDDLDKWVEKMKKAFDDMTPKQKKAWKKKNKEERDKLDRDKRNEPYSKLARKLPLSDLGEFYLRTATELFTAWRFRQRLPLYERAYALLEQRGNFSRKNAFGEMHCDRYLWIEKCDHSKVMVEEGQSYLFIYILQPYHFHIRELYYKWAWPDYRRMELKKSRLKTFRDTNFKQTEKNEAFHYGDGRDIGYLGSWDFSHSSKIWDKVDNANTHCLSAIRNIDFWEVYIDNPEELE